MRSYWECSVAGRSAISIWRSLRVAAEARGGPLRLGWVVRGVLDAVRRQPLRGWGIVLATAMAVNVILLRVWGLEVGMVGIVWRVMVLGVGVLGCCCAGDWESLKRGSKVLMRLSRQTTNTAAPS